MTVATYALGRPHPAASRGGDCRARDLNQTRNVHGPHRFAATTHCQITNGMLRLTVGASGAAPSLTVEAWRGRVTIGDTFEDVYVDGYGGTVATPAWMAMGTITIDSPAVSALLTAARITRLTPEAITIRLVAPLMGDAFVTLRRGERQVRIQHGSTRSPVITTSRRVRWTATPALVAVTRLTRVEEAWPAVDGLRRYVGALGTVTPTASTFSAATASVSSARFGAGVGTSTIGDRTIDMHRQLCDISRPRLVVA